MTPRSLVDFFLLAALWGASLFFMRVGAPEFGVFALIGLRVTLAAVCLLALVLTTRRDVLVSARAAWPAIAVVGLLNSAIPFVLLAYATLSLTAGFTALINATTAFWTAALGAIFMRQTLTRANGIGLALGIAGLVTLTWGKVDFKPGGSGLAVLAGLAATLCYGLALHWTRLRLATVAPLGIALGSQVAASVALIPLTLTYWPRTLPSMSAWVSVALLAVFCTALAYVLYFRLIAQIGSQRSAAVTLVIPAFAAFWGWIVLAEPVTTPMWIGGAFILFGTAITLGMVRVSRRAGSKPAA